MNKYSKYTFLLAILLFFSGAIISSFSQNLVKNPGFENYIQCPMGFGLFNGYIKDWYGFTGDNAASFFHACSPLPDRVPENHWGYQNAQSGNGYSCINVYALSFTPDHRTYIEGSFTVPLKKDSVYCVKYWISPCDISGGGIKNVDAFISDTLVDWNNGIYNVLVNITPQVKCNSVIIDTANWFQVHALYVAKGGEKYITIGNFCTDANTTVTPFHPGPIRIDYYIDEVSLVPQYLTKPKLGNDTSICKNSLPFHLQAPSGYITYLWSTGETSNSIMVNDSGTYWVHCIMPGCGELDDDIHISFINRVNLNLGEDTVICKGATINLQAQTGFNSYLWSTSDTTPDIIVNNQGTYIVQVSDICGWLIDSIQVDIDSLPDFNIDLGGDTTICDQGVNTQVVLLSDVPLPNYHWNTGDTTSQITVTAKGWYYLESYYYCGNLGSDSVFVDDCPKNSDYTLFIPNSFTPNDDGLNDIFSPFYNNIVIQDFKIFNRWGCLLYKSQIDFFWDGKFQGRYCPVDVYTYVLLYNDPANILCQKIGRITLLR